MVQFMLMFPFGDILRGYLFNFLLLLLGLFCFVLGLLFFFFLIKYRQSPNRLTSNRSVCFKPKSNRKCFYWIPDSEILYLEGGRGAAPSLNYGHHSEFGLPNIGPEIICVNCCANRFAQSDCGHVCFAVYRQTCLLTPFSRLAGHQPVLTHRHNVQGNVLKVWGNLMKLAGLSERSLFLLRMSQNQGRWAECGRHYTFKYDS